MVSCFVSSHARTMTEKIADDNKQALDSFDLDEQKLLNGSRTSSFLQA
jgi:hypothetical protein